MMFPNLQYLLSFSPSPYAVSLFSSSKHTPQRLSKRLSNRFFSDSQPILAKEDKEGTAVALINLAAEKVPLVMEDVGLTLLWLGVAVLSCFGFLFLLWRVANHLLDRWLLVCPLMLGGVCRSMMLICSIGRHMSPRTSKARDQEQ